MFWGLLPCMGLINLLKHLARIPCLYPMHLSEKEFRGVHEPYFLS